MRICGIDEAGRGPVIGPMVIAGTLINDHQDEDLKKMGVKDSKLLSAEQRHVLLHKIETEVLAYKSIVIPAEEIDSAVFGMLNLNGLEAKKSAEIINHLKPDKVILDCPSTNLSAYTFEVKKYLHSELRDRLEIVAEHKADAKYPSVAAASIIAKVSRDSEIDLIKADIGKDFGSGYPSDPSTKEFLAENYDKYNIFRKSWSSWRVLADAKKQTSLADFGSK